VKGGDRQREINVKNISLLDLDKFHADRTLIERCVDEGYVEYLQVKSNNRHSCKSAEN
jgi:hypothetical protein